MMEIVLCESIKPPLHNRVDNKRPASVGAILHWTPPSCMFSWFAWFGCWAWSCSWVCWWRRVMKIFVWENIDVTRHRNIAMKPYHNIMTEFQNHVAEKAVETTQRVKRIIQARFKVTICLYLSPSKRARSLSTLIVVSVNRDAPPRICPVIKCAFNA